MSNLNLLRTEISNAERNGDATVVLSIEQARQLIRDAEKMHGGNHVAVQNANIERGLYLLADAVICASWEGWQYDGGDIQELATNYGLLEAVQATELCGNDCACVEHGFPSTCYRKKYKTPAQIDKVAALLPGSES